MYILFNMRVVIASKSKICLFTKIIKSIQALSDYIHMNTDEERMYIHGVDGSQVLMYNITLPNTWFDVYEASHSENICTSIKPFEKVISFIKEGTLEITNDTDHIKIINKGDKVLHEFKIPQMEVDNEMFAVPDQEWDAVLTIDAKCLEDIIKQGLYLGHSDMKIRMTEETILFSSSSDDSQKDTMINIADVFEYSIIEGETVEVMLSIPYLNFLMIHINDRVEIQACSTRLPFFVKWENEGIVIRMYLAPKDLLE
jgi:DNA polymerase III sliding clamp (beta) subunit (PCNA family)